VSLFRRKVETRAIVDLPWDAGGVHGSSTSIEKALSLVPVYAAIGLLARGVSCTPIHAYRRIGEEERNRIGLPVLLSTMDESAQLKRWLHAAVVSLAARGNAFGLVTSRDGFGYPVAVTWLDPQLVTVDDTAPSGPGSLSMPIWYYMGRVVMVGPSDPSTSDLIHIPWFPVPGRTLGLSPLAAAATMVTGGMASQEWQAEWFLNSGIPSATMKNTARTLLPEEADAVKGRLISTIRAHKPLVYGADWDFSTISIPPAEAKFVESMKLTATQVAAIYDVPPERIGGEMGGNLSYSSPEQAALHLVTFSFRNWFELFEETFSAMLPRAQYVKFNVDSFTRADIKTRAEVYKIWRSIGLTNIDELRVLEDRSPLPDKELGKDYTPLAVASDDLPDPKAPADNAALPAKKTPAPPADRPADGPNRKDID
jgi:HK97 family phage portal protein